MLYYYYVFPTVLIFVLIRKWRTNKWGYCTNNIQLNDKVILITGANCGIGFEVAKELAFRQATVILACRNLKKANNAIESILSQLQKKNNSKKKYSLVCTYLINI